jgi:hypothetical protein
MREVKLARWIFWIAGLYGLLALTPNYFLLEQIEAESPPVTHLEYFYGFLGVGIAWQLAFLVIGHNPLRFRPLMLVAIVEKISFVIPVVMLYHRSQVVPMVFAFGMIDLLLGTSFFIAWWLTRNIEIARP